MSCDRPSQAPKCEEDTVVAAPLAKLGAIADIEINGRKYFRAERLVGLLNISARTLARWNAHRVAPPRIKVGRLILYDVGKLPIWLESLETQPVRNRRQSQT